MINKSFVVACIPAYKEEDYIGDVVSNTTKFVDKVLVCDDGSGDKTGSIAKDMGAQVILHDRNLGYGAALQSLFKEAQRLGADFVVTLDGDGQHDPKEILLLLERLKAGDVDIVIGSRFVDSGSSEAPKWRESGIKLITDIVKNNGLNLTDAQSGFRAYNRLALESLTRARSMSARAVEWGHDLAESWSQDRGFARYLTLIDLSNESLL